MMRESGFMDIPFPSEQQAEKLESLKKYIRELGSAVVAFSSGVDSTFMVDRAEQLLLDMGFHQIRVRIHGSIARIEILPFEFARKHKASGNACISICRRTRTSETRKVCFDWFEKILQEDIRKEVYEKFRAFGFSYVTLDLLGYRTGSMNETLK